MDSSPSVVRYRSIFLTEGWVHQKYFGWSILRDLDGLRILSKQRRGLRRYLLLLTSGGEAHVSSILNALPGPRALTNIVIHDFDEVLRAAPHGIISDFNFKPALPEQRLLNIATFVVDLNKGFDELWSDLGSKSRNAVRKCEKSELVFGLAPDTSAALDAFFYQSASAVARHGLNYVGKPVLMKMASEGNLAVLVAQTGSCSIQNVTLVYKSGDTALYMYGSSAEEVPTGLGQFVQWHTIKYLKEQGLRWYDLGGVPRKAPADSIYRFKESIGGAAVDLGTEYHFEGVGLRFAKHVIRWRKGLRSFFRSVPSRAASSQAKASK